MKDPIQPFLDGLPRSISDPDQRRKITNAVRDNMSENQDEKKHSDYLKNSDDTEMVMRLSKSKKLSNRQIKNKTP